MFASISSLKKFTTMGESSGDLLMKKQEVPCDVCHGAQRIVTLGDGDSGHLVHSQDGGLLLGQHVNEVRVLSWVDEAD